MEKVEMAVLAEDQEEPSMKWLEPMEDLMVQTENWGTGNLIKDWGKVQLHAHFQSRMENYSAAVVVAVHIVMQEAVHQAVAKAVKKAVEKEDTEQVQ